MTPSHPAITTTVKAPVASNRFTRIPFGSIKPGGWLERELRIQADGLSRRLLDRELFDRVLAPCGTSGSEYTYQLGAFQEGIIALAWTVGDEAFIKWATNSMNGSLAENPEDMGDTQRAHEAIIYKRARQTRGFIEYYEATRDQRVIPWLTRFFMAWGKSERKVAWWIEAGSADLALVGIWLYEQTGDRSILEIVKKKSAFVESVADSFLRFPEGEYEKHNVVVAWISRLPGFLYRIDPQQRYKKATFEGIDRREKHFGQIAGRYTGHEHFTELKDGRRPTNGTEVCGVVEYMYSMEKLFEIFGDVSLADRLELLAYNSLPGTFTPDMLFRQYDQQANQVNASVAPRGFDNTEVANTFGIAPHYPCCSFVMHQAWPRLVEHAWMATPDGDLVAVTYGPCEVTATVAGRRVTITETTDYPFDGTIRFRLSMDEPADFPIRFRIPAWADGATVTIRGDKLKCRRNAVVAVERCWNPEDEFTLTLPMKVRTETRFNDSIAILRGPLYYCLRIGQDYRDLGKGESWGIMPTAPWNYALKRGSIARAQVIRNPIGDYPFAQHGEPISCRSKDAVIKADGQISSYSRETYRGHEPVVLKVKGKLVPGWGMDKTYPANAADPPASPVVSDQPEVELELIPYGCARLRISEFPWYR